MLRRKVVSGVEVEWTLVSVKRPCMVCGGHNSCRRGFAGEFACCTQIHSEWPLMAGGWVHRLDARSAADQSVDEVVPRQRDTVGEVLSTGSSR